MSRALRQPGEFGPSSRSSRFGFPDGLTPPFKTVSTSRAPISSARCLSLPANQSINNWINPRPFSTPGRWRLGQRGAVIYSMSEILRQVDIPLSPFFAITERIAPSTFPIRGIQCLQSCALPCPAGDFSSRASGHITPTVNNGSALARGTPPRVPPISLG